MEAGLYIRRTSGNLSGLHPCLRSLDFGHFVLSETCAQSHYHISKNCLSTNDSAIIDFVWEVSLQLPPDHLGCVGKSSLTLFLQEHASGLAHMKIS